MRVTMQTINRHTQSVIHSRYAELANLQQQIATGQRLNRPSDGAIDTANTLRLKTQVAQLKQYETNIWDGMAWAEITDTTMMSMNTIIQRARELAIQGDSDALSPSERQYICDEVEQLTRQVVSLLNTRYKGDYIFSGTHTDKASVLLMESTFASAATMNMPFFNTTTAGPGGTPLTNADIGTFDPVTGAVVLGTFDPTTGTVVADNPPTPPPSIRLFDPKGSLNPSDDVQIRRIIPGSLEIRVNGQVMRENYDYKIDYMTGEMTLLDADRRWAPNLSDPTNPLSAPNPPHPMLGNFSPSGIPPNYNGLEIRMAYLDESKDLYGDNINTTGRILRQIEANVTVNINITIDDFEVNSETNILSALIRLGQGLKNSDSAAINTSMGLLDQSMHKILSAQSTNGSIINRIVSTLERNESQQIETDRLRSNLEEADYGTAITQFALKETVFNAALNSTARIMQLSLMDYVR